MAWAQPEYDVKQVNHAGRELARVGLPFEDGDILNVINNWRSIHSYPLNAFQITLRRRARIIESGIIVAQRIKRLESISAKLAREKSMKLSQMQDIGGCRVIFKELESVDLLIDRYQKGSKKGKLEHKLRGEKDYIRCPKTDGYRSYHLVYEFTGADKSAAYTGRKIEIQIRTQLQHAWATAVEAVGIFTRQALKSNQGSIDWRRFFALMSAAIAAIEGCPAVPGTPRNKDDLIKEISELSGYLNVDNLLAAYNLSLRHASQRIKEAKYFLLDLDPPSGRVTIARFRAKESEQANALYTEWERKVPDGSTSQIVLVSVDSIAALKRAYPNYFLDTRRFVGLVDQVRRGEIPEPLDAGPTIPT